jgi:hypothetical protein
MKNGPTCHMLVSACLLSRNFRCPCWVRKTRAFQKQNCQYQLLLVCTGKHWNIKIKLAFVRLLKVVGIQLSHLSYSRTLLRLTFQSHEMRAIWSIRWEQQHIKNAWFMWNLVYTFIHYNMRNIFNIHNILLCSLCINVYNLATSLGKGHRYLGTSALEAFPQNTVHSFWYPAIVDKIVHLLIPSVRIKKLC